MKEFCVIDYEMCGGRFFKKGRLREENIYIYELDITVTLLTAVCPGRIPSRLMRDAERKTAEYRDVFPLCGEFSHLVKRGSDKTVMTLMPDISLKKCVGMSGVDLENDEIAIILKAHFSQVEDEIINICTAVSFARVYGEDANRLCDRILEETGLCASTGVGEPTEHFRVIADNNITFEYIPHGRVYKELALHTPVFLDKYKKVIPTEQIFEAFLKTDKGKEYIKSKKVKIIGAM